MSNRPDARFGSGPAWRWALPALLLLLVALGWPLAVLGSLAMSPGALTDVLTDPVVGERLRTSTTQALLSSGLSLLAGLPVAWLLSRFRFPGRALVRVLVTLPLVLPAVVIALAFQQLLGPSGWVNTLLDRAGRVPIEVTGTLWAVLVAHAFFGVAVVVWVVTGACARLDPRQVEAARILGATRVQAFRHVVVPSLAPAIGSAAVLVFVFAFTSFGIVLLLGAPHLDTIEVILYRLSARTDLWPAAAVLSFVQLVMTVTALATRATLEPRGAGTPGRLAPDDRVRGLRAASWRERTGIVMVLLLVVLLVLPPAALVGGAITAIGALTRSQIATLLTSGGTPGASAPSEALARSLGFALGATAIALVAGSTAAVAVSRARGRAGVFLNALLWLPAAVPAVALAFGYLVTVNNELIDLRGSAILVLLAHTLIAYPLVLRAVLPSARSMHPHLTEAATVLGASPRHAWRLVQLPLLTRALMVGGAFAFAVSAGELGATLLLRRPAFTTAPVAIVDALGQPGAEQLGRALVLATVLLAVTVVAFLIIERYRSRDAGEV